MNVVIIIYLFGLGTYAFAGAVAAGTFEPGHPERREGARVLFLSPIWPRLALRWLADLWREYRGSGQ